VFLRLSPPFSTDTEKEIGNINSFDIMVYLNNHIIFDKSDFLKRRDFKAVDHLKKETAKFSLDNRHFMFS
jgi:hypothetical protein